MVGDGGVAGIEAERLDDDGIDGGHAEVSCRVRKDAPHEASHEAFGDEMNLWCLAMADVAM